jgi:hypothetical protein
MTTLIDITLIDITLTGPHEGGSVNVIYSNVVILLLYLLMWSY